MSVLGLKPMVAHLMEIVVVMMKSGIARCDGKRMHPPLFAWIWLMYSECAGIVCMERRVVKKGIDNLVEALCERAVPCRPCVWVEVEWEVMHDVSAK